MTRLIGWICTLSLAAMSATAASVNYQGPWWAAQAAPNTFTGTLHEDWQYGDWAEPERKARGAFHPVERRQRELLGTARFVFTDDNNGSLTYQGITYQISRVPDAVHP
jgi:hypothetical protein